MVKSTSEIIMNGFENISQEISDYAIQLGDSQVKTLNLSDFLQNIENPDIENSEKLRQLAIKIESRFFFEEKEKWEVLEAIYLRGISENAEDAILHESRGISASMIIALSQDEGFKKELLKVGIDSFSKSLSLGNNDARLYYHWGYLHYPANLSLAIEKFEEALKIEEDYAIASMYLGYSYFDLKNWEKAISALGKVNEEELRGHWEKIKSLELIACAQIESGSLSEGISLLNEKVVSEYKLGRYNADDLDLDLAHPTEMIRTLKNHKLYDLLQKIQLLIS